MAQYTSPAIIGQGVSQGIQDARNIQAFSMQAAQMRAIQKQDVENQMPITLDKIKGIIPPDMHDATLNMAKSMGIVENVDGQDFIRKGKFQEFGDAIQKNSILKANLLEQTIHGLSAKQEPLLKEFQALKQDHDMRNADWEYKLQQLEKDAKENGSPIDMKKRDSIMKERNEFMGGDQVKKMSALGEQLSQLEELKMRRTQGLGVIDERYKRMASTIGEYAIPVMSGQMSYQEALRLVAIQKQQAEKTQEQWSDPYETNIGGKKLLVRRNLGTNKVEKVDADKSTTVIVKPDDNRRDMKDAMSLRKEFNNLPDVKEANQVIPKIRSMEKSYATSQKTKNFVATDQALITLFNKLTDPTSVVRESEYARTAMNIPLFNQIQGKAEKILRGGAGLTNEERSQLINMSRELNKAYSEMKKLRINEYRGYGRQAGLKDDFLYDSSDNASVDDSPSIPKEAIAELKKNPNTAKQFDEIFGQGASKRYLGGK